MSEIKPKNYDPASKVADEALKYMGTDLKQATDWAHGMSEIVTFGAVDDVAGFIQSVGNGGSFKTNRLEVAREGNGDPAKNHGQDVGGVVRAGLAFATPGGLALKGVAVISSEMASYARTYENGSDLNDHTPDRTRGHGLPETKDTHSARHHGKGKTIS